MNSFPESPTSRCEMWREIINENCCRSVAEIGVWKGDFAESILRECPSIERYFMIDPWARLPDWNKPFNVASEQFDKVFEEAMNKTEFARAKVEVLRGRTVEVVDRITDGSLDFAYVDGDHTLRGITIDLIRILPKVRKKGIIAGDDFVPFRSHHAGNYEPTFVCPFAVYFAEAANLPITLLPHRQFLIENDPDKGFSFNDATGSGVSLSLAPGKLMGRLAKFASRIERLVGQRLKGHRP